MAEQRFSAAYSDTGLFAGQIRIRADKELTGQRKGIAGHPFGTIKRGSGAGYCLTRLLRNESREFPPAFLAYNIRLVTSIPGCGKLAECMAG
ncbi:MAG: hypothetical protein LBO04_08175 [Spirochaetaceae bacterium]|jgi:transposase|nr:hypothetical protein [Spirochaetaceae bacterium]